MATTATAQVPDRRGFFASLDGRWMWLGGDRLDASLGVDGPSTSGPGGQLMLGYKLSPAFDVALAGDVQGLITELTKFRNGTLSVDTNHQHFDLEAGFSNDNLRFDFGLRGIHYNQVAGYNVPGFAGYDQREMFGIGPKVGVGGRLPLWQSWALVGGADAALLYTNFLDSGTGVLLNSGSYWQFVPQLDGEIGLSWRSADSPAFSFAVGGRVAASFNTSVTADGGHKGTLLEVGPFVRVAYNFSGPAGPAKVANDGWPMHPSVTPDSGARRVFFAFDSAELSPLAGNELRQVAADTRLGKRRVVRLEGPADRGTLTAEGDALTSRRIDAVRQELVRYGVNEHEIAVGTGLELATSGPLICIAK